MARTGVARAKQNSDKRARRIGVWPVDLHSGFGANIERPDLWVFGPDPQRDNVYANMPQPSLHGMDEGLTAKLNYGCLKTALVEVRGRLPSFSP